MVVDFEAEGAGAGGDRLADAAHADDAEAFAGDAVAEHPGGRPAGPCALMLAQVTRALAQAARHGEDQRHRHVGGVFGEDAGCVRHRDAAAARALDVDIVDAGAELGDQAEIFAGLSQQLRVDAVGDGGDQHIGLAHGGGQLGWCHRAVIRIEADIEKLAHAGLDGGGQFAGDDDKRLFGGHAGGTPVANSPY